MIGHVVTIASLKGGSGKSTVAASLAAHWQAQGRKPVLLDADPQRSLPRLAEREKKLNNIPIIEDTSENLWKTARRLANRHGVVVIDTPGFRSEATIASLAAAHFVLIPVKPSPLDVDLMMDTVGVLMEGVKGWTPTFRCVLTQTIPNTVIARHLRSELAKAGFPLLETEIQNRVAYGEAALYGATPNLMDASGAASRDIAAMAGEIEALLSTKRKLTAA
jgi:chromosome partitioning protein